MYVSDDRLRVYIKEKEDLGIDLMKKVHVNFNFIPFTESRPVFFFTPVLFTGNIRTTDLWAVR